jgi:hypothetical protein
MKGANLGLPEQRPATNSHGLCYVVKIKSNEKTGHVVGRENTRNPYKVLVGKPEGNAAWET